MGEVHHGAAWGGKLKSVDGSEPPSDDAGMDDRLKTIEALIPTLATKADLEKSAHDLVKWIVGTTFVGMGMFITIMTFVLNNAVSKPSAAPASPPVTIQSAPPAPAPQPIIIQMPAQPQPPLANPATPPASKP